MKARPFRRLLETLSPRDSSRRLAARRRPTIEFLETRELLSTTFTVTNAGDNGNNTSPLPGSLRSAIVQADALKPGTASTIQFAIPGGAFQTIALKAPLPQITTPATIDGTTQTGYTGTPLIELDGTSAGAGANGLSYASSASGTASVLTQVKALQIFSFNGAAVMDSGASYLSLTNDEVGVQRLATYYLARGNAGGVVISGGAHDTITSSVISANMGNGVTITGSGADYDTISADDLGTDASGVTIVDHTGKNLANTGNGVLISAGANHNTVTSSVLSNNQGDGVELTGSGTSSNVVSGDHLGTDVFGMIALPNLYNGVEVTGGASANTVGGTTASARDIISGNTDSGVSINTGATTTVVEGDFIGTDGTGTVAIPNHTGALVGASPSNTIGGTTAGSGDVISGNINIGVWLTSGASKEVLAGDDIGTDLTGSQGVPNGTGVQIDASSTSNTVGGAVAGSLNLISGNTGAGVYISDSGTTNNLVAGDYIGTNASGAAALGNGNSGVMIANSANGNTVGGTTAFALNLISGNSPFGVDVTNGVSGTKIEGNDIGTDATGSLSVPNDSGVNVGGGSTSNTVGGTVAGSLNVISGNVHKAVTITDAGTEYNLVEGDYIGTDKTGAHALGNGGAGVSIANGARSNTVGGMTATARNVFAASAGNGVLIGGVGANNTSTSNNVVEGDYIGTDKTGTVALGEGIAGVNLQSGATNNTIGGTTAAARNVISESYFGVYIAGMGTNNNVVEGDYIGTDVTGTKALGNVSNGVVIIGGASNNTIGGTTVGAGDVISGNIGNGIDIVGAGTSNNVLAGDYIGTDDTGSHALSNGARGLLIVEEASNNTIGGTSSAARDVISGNVDTGVWIQDEGTNNNVVDGDYIGTDKTGAVAIGNGAGGVVIANGASNNIIGGSTAGALDVISGNVGTGVDITDSGTAGNFVSGDYIGTTVNGTGNLGNSGDGVLLDGVTGDSITNSLICYNGAYGIEGISGSNATNNTITGDTFTVTIGSITYGNKEGATYYH